MTNALLLFAADDEVSSPDDHHDVDVVYPVRLSTSGQPVTHSGSHFIVRRSAAFKPSPAADDLEQLTRSSSTDDASTWHARADKHFSLRTSEHQLMLQLTHDARFIAADVIVDHVGVNSSRRWVRDQQQNDCYYTGKVEGDPRSSVALSLCGHMVSLASTLRGFRGSPSP